MNPLFPLQIFLAVVLVACPSGTDTSKPSISISSPPSDTNISNITPIQLDATDNAGIAKVEVYARARNSGNRGVLLGSAVAKPFVISWDSNGVPNGDYDLIGVATDTSGNTAEGSAVRVRVGNANVPSLNYLVAYSLPPKPVAALQLASLDSVSELLPSNTARVLQSTKVPVQKNVVTQALPPHVFTQATVNRTLAMEWSWQSFQSVGSLPGADGYSVWLSKTDGAGLYDRVVNQASSTSGTQKYSREYPDAVVGQSYFGAVKAIINSRTTETGFSNSDSAKFPQTQEAMLPIDGAVFA